MSAQDRSTQLFDGQESYADAIEFEILEVSPSPIARYLSSSEKNPVRLRPICALTIRMRPALVTLRVASTDSPSEV
jgi:hypothetical protein